MQFILPKKMKKKTKKKTYFKRKKNINELQLIVVDK